MKKSEKIYNYITKDISLIEYNKWLQRLSKLSQEEKYLVFCGIRLAFNYEDELYPNERLPKTSKKEYEYYSKLKVK